MQDALCSETDPDAALSAPAIAERNAGPNIEPERSVVEHQGSVRLTAPICAAAGELESEA